MVVTARQAKRKKHVNGLKKEGMMKTTMAVKVTMSGLRTKKMRMKTIDSPA